MWTPCALLPRVHGLYSVGVRVRVRTESGCVGSGSSENSAGGRTNNAVDPYLILREGEVVHCFTSLIGPPTEDVLSVLYCIDRSFESISEVLYRRSKRPAWDTHNSSSGGRL